MSERNCPVTGEVCVVLDRAVEHPGRKVTISEDGKTRMTVNNTENADLARRIANKNPEACRVFSAEDVCGAMYSRFAEIWGPMTDDLDKVSRWLEGRGE